jgi:chorismate synthase
MSGNRFGTLFSVTTFGESHGGALGCVVDGCPAGVPLSVDAVAKELARRRPGAGASSTARREADAPEILSGVFEGQTLGTPIAIIVRNTDQQSADYDALRDVYRPGHTDWVWEAKYGRRDHRGGGRSSGRETLGRVAAGAIAKAFLARYGILITAWTSSAAGITVPGPEDPLFDLAFAEENPLRVANRVYAEKIMERIERLRSEGDSAGGVVSCSIRGVPAGLGEPVFDKLDACLSSAMLSIGASKGIEFGAGFAAADGTGSLLNDCPLPGGAFLSNGVPALRYRTNNAGGILGGLATGMPIEFRVAFKPVPSIAKKQETVDRNGTARELIISGRHDVCIVPRAVPVVEAMAALVLADMVLLQRGAL